MKKRNQTFHLLLFFFLSLSAFPSMIRASDNEIKVMDFKQLEPLLHQQNDTLYVVNFWATWCAPCVEEVPYFEQVGEQYGGRKVKVLMVSLDFPDQIHSRLVPFIEKTKMKNEIVLLDDPNSNRWIPLVSESWTGAIPATLIYRNSDDFRQFYQQTFTLLELQEIIDALLKE